MSNNQRTSIFISFILRHKPDAIGITLDEHGWANVEELIEGVSKTRPLTMELLEQIVAEDEKQRYSFNEDKTLIRANQGHSIPVDVELPEVEPPMYLYHGTAEKYVESIEEQGLLPKSRLYVHMSGDYDTAVKVGTRHGKPVVYRVLSGRMAEQGYKFFRSVNGVWLTKAVPKEFLERNAAKHINVAAAVIRQGDSIYATARGYGEYKGWWEFPGGKIDAGETPEQALKREIMEELDTVIEVGEHIDTIEYDYPAFHLTMHCYWATIVQGVPNPKEADEAGWLTKDNIDSVQWLPADISLIGKIKESI